MPTSSPRLTAVALAVLSVAFIAREYRTPDPLPASVPKTEFSAERALEHVKVIAARPHAVGSAANTAVREYIVRELRALGLEPELQEATGVSTRYPAVGRVVNIIARMKGSASSAHALVIAAHYDGVPAAPAAGDDASGSSALLETLRALRAGPPLKNDVIALFTDGEESGLLGAAAFTREHRWAKEADVFMNFEARGTNGRSTMFETGPGNLDMAREIAHVSDVSAGSLMVTVYRNLPNDTDLSEFAVLGRPALNFAFIGGVVRYHTAHDDVAHLSLGSLQHDGNQMLTLARSIGNGPLPRVSTPDAVFFTVPLLGVVVYPEPWGIAFAALAAVLVLLLLRATAERSAKWWGGAVSAIAGTVVVAAFCGWSMLRLAGHLHEVHQHRGWLGGADWRGIYAAGLGILSLGLASAAWVLLRRWFSASALYAGVLVLWTVQAAALAVKLPGVSYLTVWPVIFFTISELVGMRAPDSLGAAIARWAATLVTFAVVLPVLATVGGYALPLAGPGGIAIGVLTALLAWVIAPQLEAMRGGNAWWWPSVCGIAAVACVASGMMSVRRSPDYPETVNLTYAMQADGDSAYLVAPGSSIDPGTWAQAALGTTLRFVNPKTDSEKYGWLADSRGSGSKIAVRALPRIPFGTLDATVLSDSVAGSNDRYITVHIIAPSGTQAVSVNGPTGARLVSVDGVPSSAERYRRAQTSLGLVYSAPRDSGFVIGVALPKGTPLALALTAVATGLPAVSGLTVPPRPDDVVPIQNGDVTVRYRKIVLP